MCSLLSERENTGRMPGLRDVVVLKEKGGVEGGRRHSSRLVVVDGSGGGGVWCLSWAIGAKRSGNGNAAKKGYLGYLQMGPLLKKEQKRKGGWAEDVVCSCPSCQRVVDVLSFWGGGEGKRQDLSCRSRDWQMDGSCWTDCPHRPALHLGSPLPWPVRPPPNVAVTGGFHSWPPRSRPLTGQASSRTGNFLRSAASSHSLHQLVYVQ